MASALNPNETTDEVAALIANFTTSVSGDLDRAPSAPRKPS